MLSSSRGFTLLELLVTLVIAALLVVLVAPQVGGLLASAELEGETRKVASLLRYARSQAVLLNQDTLVRLSEDPHGLNVSGRAELYQPPANIRLDLSAGRGEAETAVPTGLAAAIRFYPAGGSSGGSIVLSLEGGRSTSISADWLSGRVRIDE